MISHPLDPWTSVAASLSAPMADALMVGAAPALRKGEPPTIDALIRRRLVSDALDLPLTRRGQGVAERLRGVRFTQPLRVLDLFSGIGGFSLGLERAGMVTVAFCETDPYCRGILARHWPEVPCYDDIEALGWERLAADGLFPGVDVICGGFPCQGVSNAGARAGLDDDRSGLWREMRRLVREVRPSFVVVENVAALCGRGLDAVLGDLAALGYDAEWHCLPAGAFGAPHIRDRIWIVAYAHRGRRQVERWARRRGGEGQSVVKGAFGHVSDGRGAALADAGGQRRDGEERPLCAGRDAVVGGGEAVADAGGQRPQVRRDAQRLRQCAPAAGGGQTGVAGGHRIIPNPYGVAAIGPAIARRQRRNWGPEPNVGRVAYGVPDRVDRLKALGNAVVPDIPEFIGAAIVEIHACAPIPDDPAEPPKPARRPAVVDLTPLELFAAN